MEPQITESSGISILRSLWQGLLLGSIFLTIALLVGLSSDRFSRQLDVILGPGAYFPEEWWGGAREFPAPLVVVFLSWCFYSVIAVLCLVLVRWLRTRLS